MVVTAGDEAKVRASVEFLKWFTLPENNISFSVGSGYMPVTKAANNMAEQPEAAGQIRTSMMMGLVFIETVIIYALIVAILFIFVL